MLKARHILHLFVSLFLFTAFSCPAQEGSSFITDYQLSESDIDNQNWAIEQASDHMMLFANRRGILCFDGVEWELVKTPTFPLSIAKDTSSGNIYIGCSNNFGYLLKDDRGVYSYISISQQFTGFDEISHIIINSQYIYFYSDAALFRVSKKDLNDIKQFKCNPSQPFTGIVKLNEHVFLNVSNSGLQKMEAAGPSPFTGGSMFSSCKILMYIPFDKNSVLLGTSENKFFLFNGQTFEPRSIEAEPYLKENIFSGGIDLSVNEFVLATLTGGCVVADKKTGKNNYIINYQTGLPDDEVFAMGKDNYGGLWVSHEYGISRIDNLLPVKNFSTYPGLEGNLTSLVDFNKKIYVSSSRGVFYLSEVKDYKEVEILVKPRTEKSNSESIRTKTEKPESKTKEAIQQEPQKLSKREQRKLKRAEKKEKKRKEKEEKSEQTEAEEAETGDKTSVFEKLFDKPKKEEEVQSIKTYALQSIKHVFKKVEGLDEKCRQLITCQDRILVATNTGLYEIKDNKAIVLVKDSYINHIHQSRNPKRFYVATSTGIFSVFLRGAAWEIENYYEGINENVYTVIEDDKGNLWLGCENSVHTILLDKTAHPVAVKTYNFNNDYSERVLARNILGKPFFFLSSGFYSYYPDKDSVLYNPEVNRNFPANSKYIFSQQNLTWIFTGGEWLNLNKTTGSANINEMFLELFDNIQNIYVDSDKNMWVIDGNNSLYKIKASEKPRTGVFDVYFKQVTNDSGFIFSLTKLMIDYKNSSLEFHLAAPFYVKKGSTQYQYMVEGLMNSWSKWDNKSTVQLPFIPPGKYKLRVRAKNVLGELSGERTFEFSVSPPFWKTWWFLFTCTLAGIAFIFIIIKIRERNLKRTQKLLEEKVKLRTAQLEAQTEKTEQLLLNILPAETADELKSKGKATARHYNLVSVMFTDFKGFTAIAETIEPQELVNKLDECFVAFDEIITKYHLEKIKTIGDAYMCAGGLPIRNDGNPVLITLAALEICRFMEKLAAEKKAKGQVFWELRLGIHTGSIIAGVVGKKKFAYDIWGDTVNTASRMESSGIPGKVNISGATYEFIKGYFDCSHRGKIDAKNKGKIDMYFVERIKPEYSVNGNGIEPNEVFGQIISAM